MLTTTTTATRTLTRNTSLLQEIKDDYRHLNDLRIAVRALTESETVLNGHRKRLVTLLDKLRDQLAMHFTIEEAYGHFDEATESVPRSTEIADQLRDQHSELFATLMNIAADAIDIQAKEFPSSQLKTLVERIRDFDAALCDHEADEARLIFEAIDRNIDRNIGDNIGDNIGGNIGGNIGDKR